MTTIDSLARARVSRYICTGITLVFLGAGLFAAQQGRDASARDAAAQVWDAQAEARNIANTVLFTNLSYASVTAPISAPLYRDITVGLQGQAFTHSDVARIRVWRPDGILQFSTHERDQVGLLQAVSTTLIDEAMKGQSASEQVFTKFNAATTGIAVPTDLLEVFVPLHVPDQIAVAAVAEIDYYYGTRVHPLPHPWFKLVVIFGFLALVSLIPTLLSYSERARTLAGRFGPWLRGGTPMPPLSHEDAPVPSRSAARTAPQEEAEVALARATKAEAEVAGLREELDEVGGKLRRAEEAYHFLGVQRFLGAKTEQWRALQGGPPTPADTARVDELKVSLARAEAQLAAIATESPDAVLASQVLELESDIALLAERARVAEQRMREAEERANAAEDKALEATMRARAAEAAAAEGSAQAPDAVGVQTLADAARALEEAETALASKSAELALAQEAVGRLRAELLSREEKVATAATCGDLEDDQELTGWTDRTRAAPAEELLTTMPRIPTKKKSAPEAGAQEAANGAAAAPSWDTASEPMPAAFDEAVLVEFDDMMLAAEHLSEDAEAKIEGLDVAQALAQVTSGVDTAATVSDLRARLARTAARKKPGGGGGLPPSEGP